MGITVDPATIADVIRSSVAFAKAFCAAQGLLVQVTHTPRTTVGGTGGALVEGTPVLREAFVEYKTRTVGFAEGRELVSRATVLFLEDAPISPLDRIVLPDGTTGPILSPDGVADPLGVSYYRQVYLG